ncbi:MAG: S8 family serine peptidase [bacterium]|nr:S8 family serine peptidase [bacterium]
MRTALLLALALAAAPLPAAADYYYSSGRRHRLSRLPGLWAASSEADGRAGARRPHRIVRAPDRAAAAASLPRGVPRRFLNPVFDDGGGRPLVITDEFVARFRPGLDARAIDEVNARHGAVILRHAGGPPECLVLSAGGGELAALRLANRYVEEGHVAFAHPNFIARREKRLVPDDPLFPRQWHLLNDGQGGGVPDQDIDVTAAWDITRGDPAVVIAVIDDGVDFGHEDFNEDMFVPGHDFIDDDDDPSAVESNGDFHGTAVTGIAAARAGNGIGVSGVAPECRVMPIRLVAGKGETTPEQEGKAIRRAADEGAWIISNSWGPPDGDPIFRGDEVVYPLPDIVREAIDHAAENGRGGKGCVIVWAAGNGNEPVGLDGYASHEKVLAVGACTATGARAFYSDYGPELDLVAPSGDGHGPGIWTTDYSGSAGYNPAGQFYEEPTGNYTGSFAGTSASAPIVAGVAALLLSVEPDLTRAEAMERLRRTADRIDPSTARYDLDGHSDLYGTGRVNAYAALTGSTRHPRLSIAAEPDRLRPGGIPSLRFEMFRGRDRATNDGAVYLAVGIPAGGLLFVGPDYALSAQRIPFVPRISASDMSGSVSPGASLGRVPVGRYMLYTAIVGDGSDPVDPAAWRHAPARAAVEILP